MNGPLNSPPALVSAHDYGIETIAYTPKLVKSLMHKKVIRISSGGVHNICIVEPKPSCILKDVYNAFKEGKFVDVTFKGFYQIERASPDNEKGNLQNSNDSSEKASDDEMKEEQNPDETAESGAILQSQRRNQENYWNEKPRVASQKQISAHIPVIVTKSTYFQQLLFEKLKKRTNHTDKIVVDFGGQVLYEAFRKVLDFFYLNDVAVIEGVSDSAEMMEIIKLAKTY